MGSGSGEAVVSSSCSGARQAAAVEFDVVGVQPRAALASRATDARQQRVFARQQAGRERIGVVPACTGIVACASTGPASSAGIAA